MTIGFGLIGFGRWGRHHAGAIVEIEEAELLAVSARSEHSCRSAGEEFGADTYRDYRQLLARQDIEVVNIVTPNHLHSSMAIEALRSGKHVLLEKPMGISVEQCDDILRTVQSTGKLLFVGFELRVSALWAGINEAVERGEIGRPTHTVIDLWRGPYREGSRGWRFDRQSVGSWILEEPVHFLDLACWYMEGCGRASSIYAKANNKTGDEEGLAENMSFIVNFSENGYAVVNQTLGGYGHHQIVRMVGTEGALWAKWSAPVDDALHPSFSLEVFDGEEVREVPIPEKAGATHELKVEIAEMARAVETGSGSRLATPQDGKRAVVLSVLGEESSRQNAVIDLAPYFQTGSDA